MRARTVAALALAALVAACVKPPAPAVEVPAGPPPGVDGRYRGTARLIRAGSAGCPRSGARVLEVSGDSLTLSYRLSARQLVQLTAPIAPDGGIQASDGAGSIEGHIGDGKLEVTVASRMCENHWIMTKVD